MNSDKDDEEGIAVKDFSKIFYDEDDQTLGVAILSAPDNPSFGNVRERE